MATAQTDPSPARTASRALPYLASATALFLIGTSAPAASELGQFPIFGGQAIRSAAAAVVLLLVAWRAPGGLVRPTGRQFGGLLLLATVGIAGFNSSVVAAVRHADPAVVGTVIAATPVILALVAPLRARVRPSAQVVAGCVLVAGGTALASGFGSADGLGTLLCGVALLCEVGFALLAVPLLPALGSLRVTAYAIGLSVPVLCLAGLVVDGPSGLVALPTASEAWSLAYLALPIGVGANLFWYYALSRIPADRAGLFYAFTPVGSLLAALVVTGSSPSLREVLGILVVAAGLAAGLAPRRGAAPETGGTPTREEARGIH